MKKINLIILFVLISINFLVITNDKLKLYTFYTPSHEKLFVEWFLPTLQDDFELIVEKYPQECPSASLWEDGWGKTMLRKVNLILRGINENWGKIFIYADIDIQFFRPMEKLIIDAMKNKDVVFQKNSPRGDVCAGFIVCRGNENTKMLWENIKKIMIATQSPSDESTLNSIIGCHVSKVTDKKVVNSIVKASGFKGVKWSYLPVTFFGGGTLSGVGWVPGKELLLPDNIEELVLHHANWSRGIEKKIQQFIYVRTAFNNKKYN